MASTSALGIIGGSGLYELEGLRVCEEVAVDTPFGSPSDRFLIGEVSGRSVVFLPRHGREHTILPGELNFRANIYGFKKLGVDRLVSVSAVGSMKEDIHPCHVVIPDQFIDRTRGRKDTFFGDGVVAHVSFADPVCADLRRALAAEAEEAGVTAWNGGTYVCIQGPAFSTRAESHVFRSWGVSVIGMTNLPEAKLAREAELCYATVALVTDYDCWHESEEDVSVEVVMQNMANNTAAAQKMLSGLVARLPDERQCGCGNALAAAIVTPPGAIPSETRERLDIIIGKYVE
jgi:5'-methylthioadenosine phosphorylase